jgi:lipopolysaccharide/colanic/teichoic acid biosynthesis glycosyltransferase
MDIVLSVLLLVVAFPFLLLIALLIKLDSPGPVLFRQERIGLRNRSAEAQERWQLGTFVMFKFRTMHQNSAPSAHQQLMKALIRGDEYDLDQIRHHGDSVVHKLSNDRRITRVGKLLRRTNLDELPQLWNVLRGEMSLVGPRPPLLYEVEQYKPHHWKRLGTIPGCVGLWQVSGWNTLGFDEMVKLDVWYIEHPSVWLDLRILLQAASAILSGRGGG